MQYRNSFRLYQFEKKKAVFKLLVRIHLEFLNPVIDEHSKTYDNFIFIEDFNVVINSMKNFCDINCLESLIKEPTCFKNPEKPTCIDLILTNTAHTIRTQQYFWNRLLRLPSFDSNWIQKIIKTTIMPNSNMI